MDKRPIGVFDSGVGGLTVVKEMLRKLPNEDIVYFGDTARVPYGNKSNSTITRFSIENALFLLRFNVKMIVAACNTSSSTSLKILKKNFKVPIVGVIQPGVRGAAGCTKNKRIGIIGTRTTIASRSYEKQLKKLMPETKIFTQACPLFVPLAEEGWINNGVAGDIAKVYLRPLKKSGIDTLILGCTHYPIMKNKIKEVVGKRVHLIDSAKQVAEEVKQILDMQDMAAGKKNKGSLKLYVSDEPGKFAQLGEKFLGRKIKIVKKVRNQNV